MTVPYNVHRWGPTEIRYKKIEIDPSEIAAATQQIPFPENANPPSDYFFGVMDTDSGPQMLMHKPNGNVERLKPRNPGSYIEEIIDVVQQAAKKIVEFFPKRVAP